MTNLEISGLRRLDWGQGVGAGARKDEKDLKDERTGAKYTVIKTALKSDVAKYAAPTIAPKPADKIRGAKYRPRAEN